MKEIVLDSLLDTLKLIPFLFVAFLILEFIEHKMGKKQQNLLVNNRKFGPLIGAILGAFPQCGFSSMATNLYARRVITLGTLIAVYLSTSDEMLPIFISSGMPFFQIFKVILAKVVIGIILGLIIDLIYRKKSKNYTNEINSLCEEEKCHCNHGVVKSSIIHTMNIALFILIASLVLNLLIHYIGEDNLSNLLMQGKVSSYFFSSLIGLIPNCASSVIITEMYLENMISLGNLMAGLLTGSGVGILILFRTNKNLRENIFIALLIYSIGVICGVIIDLVGWVL